jgi:hypothetical protein
VFGQRDAISGGTYLRFGLPVPTIEVYTFPVRSVIRIALVRLRPGLGVRLRGEEGGARGIFSDLGIGVADRAL